MWATSAAYSAQRNKQKSSYKHICPKMRRFCVTVMFGLKLITKHILFSTAQNRK